MSDQTEPTRCGGFKNAGGKVKAYFYGFMTQMRIIAYNQGKKIEREQVQTECFYHQAVENGNDGRENMSGRDFFCKVARQARTFWVELACISCAMTIHQFYSVLFVQLAYFNFILFCMICG